MIGEKFDRLTIISTTRRNNIKHFICKCNCGTVKEIHAWSVLKGIIKSCGCYQKDMARTHGGYKNRSYNSWSLMKERCNNSNSPNYKYYGGRGIKYYPAWEDYSAFLADMGDAPPKTSLGRKDNNGNYEPGNCYWATPKEQANNTRSNKLITWNGDTKTISQWADFFEIKYSLLHSRLSAGWPLEKAGKKPSQRA